MDDDGKDLQSSVLGCLIIVCRLGAEVACTNWNDSRQCGENADGGNQVSPHEQPGRQHLVAESICAPVVLQMLLWPSTTRSYNYNLKGCSQNKQL